jgi:glycosyltransferase involved in cell wall biosynthesis
MRIAIISATTFPASLPSDTSATQGYGSESSMATLAQALARQGHDIGFYAPTGSSRFYKDARITYHPIKNSHGEHIPEDLDNCALDGSKYTDLFDYDFIISGEKLCHNIEQLYYHNPNFRNYCCYRSGYADYEYPAGVPKERRHYVTHCNYFKEIFKSVGQDADVAFFGINEFWEPIKRETDPHYAYFTAKYGLVDKEYWLFPHRPSYNKGIDVLLQCAQFFPDQVFVIQSATPLQDHKVVMKQCKQVVKDKALSNVKFVDIPQTPYYQYHRRALICGAKAVLAPYPYPSPYHDTGGLVGAEAMRCGVPLIVTRSPGSQEWWGSQDEKGVLFINGVDGARNAIRNWSTYDLKPECPYTTEQYANNYMEIINKYHG